MRFSTFVRIRPGGVVEDTVRSDYDVDDDIREVVALALSPLPPEDEPRLADSADEACAPSCVLAVGHDGPHKTRDDIAA